MHSSYAKLKLDFSFKRGYNYQIMMQVKTAPRAAKEKKEGFIPAVYYGAHATTTSIFVDVKDLNKVLTTEGMSSSIVLVTEHGNETAMIQDVQRDPVKNTVSHADFYILEKGQKVHVKIPLVFTGESQAVKDGGVLVKVLHELSVDGDPSTLPHDIAVDLSKLASATDVITVASLALPKGATLYHVNADDVVASISAATELGEIASVDLSAIEVEKKGKKEESVTE